MTRTSWMTLGTAIAAALIALPTMLAGCQDDDDDNNGGGGTGGTATTTTTTSQGGSAGNGGTGTGAGGSGSGGDVTCGSGAIDTTIPDITQGNVGMFVDVKVEGVVAMSQKFLVSKGSSGSCLWGVFVSAPGLATTEAYSGILALSYGFPAEVPDGGTKAYCPVIGVEPAGDKIPDDTQPGDVLTLIGETDKFLLSNCSEPGDAEVGQIQLAKVCSAEKTGTAAVPAAAVLSGDDVAKLGSPLAADESFHNQWGGVKVRIENVSAGLPTENPPDPDPCGEGGGAPGGESVVSGYGEIQITDGPGVGDKVYYVGFLKYSDVCKNGPLFCTETGTYDFNFVEGFSYLNYCTWGIQPNDKCADFDPQSEDCEAASCAP